MQQLDHGQSTLIVPLLDRREDGRLGDPEPDDQPDGHHDHAGEEGHPPTPGEELLMIEHRREQQHHPGGQR
jgi:hypothetical protein